MKVDDKKHVTLEYSLSLDSGEIIDSSTPDRPLEFICGTGQIIPGLENALKGMEEGESGKITVEPGEAYGNVNADLIRDIPRNQFPSGVEIKPGMSFEANSPQGPVRFVVKEVTDEKVVADFNHPLAGQRLHFDVTVKGVRDLTPEEDAALSAASCGCTPSSCGSCGGGC